MSDNDFSVQRLSTSHSRPAREPGKPASLNIEETIKRMVLCRINKYFSRRKAAKSLGITVKELESYIRQFGIDWDGKRYQYFFNENKKQQNENDQCRNLAAKQVA